MSAIGHLDAAGILYEGNWAVWHSRITATLKHHGLGIYLDERQDRIYAKNAEKAMCMVRDSINKPLLARLSEEHNEDLPKALSRLEKMAQPFRFLDLSAEPRNKVYRLALPREVDPIGWTKAALDMRRFALPPVTRASSQLRGETISLFYGETVFAIDCDYLNGCDRVERNFQPWLRQVAQPHLQHLQSVGVYSSEAGWSVKLDFDEDAGLKTRVTDRPCTLVEAEDGDVDLDFFNKNMATFEDHVRAIEIGRRGLDLNGGQAMAMALGSAYTIWEKLRDRF